MTGGLRLRDVRQRFGEAEILRGVDLEVAAGETVAVLGPSGAGKTTLLRIVAGLDPLTAGSVTIGDRDVSRVPPGGRDVAMVFQNHALLPHLNVTENVAFGLRARRAPRGEIDERVATAAALARCDHLLGRPVAGLSGGERQRVALARAVARRPALLLLDEPFANLDATTRTELRAELRQALDELAATVLHVTHDQAEAMTLGHRVAVLGDGAVLQIDTPDELYERPASLEVARFLGVPATNVLPVSAGSPARAGPLPLPGTVVVPAAAAIVAAVRPEAVHLGGGTPAEVRRVEVTGSDAMVHLDVDGVALVARTARADRPEAGATVAVSLASAGVHLFNEATGAAVTP